MGRRRKSSLHGGIGDQIEDMKEWVSDHTKIVMPIVLLVCVLITVLVAVNANKKAAEEAEAQLAGVDPAAYPLDYECAFTSFVMERFDKYYKFVTSL